MLSRVHAMPLGVEKVATSEPPSAKPTAPEPAIVVTSPLLTSTCRMRRLLVSTTSSRPPPASAICRGALKRACVPTPSANAAALYVPASVVTVPLDTSIVRMRSPISSATYTVAPSSVVATPHGW